MLLLDFIGFFRHFWVRVPSCTLVKFAETLINTAFPFFFASANLKTAYQSSAMKAHIQTRRLSILAPEISLCYDIFG